MSKDCEKMRKYYFAILWEVSLYYNINAEDLHDMLKVWYKVETTTAFTSDDRYVYLDKVVYFMMWVFDMFFDVDYFKNENISFVWMYWSERPDNFNLLF